MLTLGEFFSGVYHAVASTHDECQEGCWSDRKCIGYSFKHDAADTTTDPRCILNYGDLHPIRMTTRTAANLATETRECYRKCDDYAPEDFENSAPVARTIDQTSECYYSSTASGRSYIVIGYGYCRTTAGSLDGVTFTQHSETPTTVAECRVACGATTDCVSFSTDDNTCYLYVRTGGIGLPTVTDHSPEFACYSKC
jgi:hypothetical protein